jgi:hypothetical protein
MTNEEKMAALLALHNPAAQQQGMVYEVWEDGEVTLTKGGDLYGQRSVHMVEPGNPAAALPVDAFPKRNWNDTHGWIQCMNSRDANEACTIIKGPCPYGTWLCILAAEQAGARHA